MSTSDSTSVGAKNRSQKQFFSYADAFISLISIIALNLLVAWLDVTSKTLWIVLSIGILFVISGRILWRIIMR